MAYMYAFFTATLTKQRREYIAATYCHLMMKLYVNTSLQLVGDVTVNQSVRAKITQPSTLHDCSFTIEGAGLTDSKPVTEKYVPNHLDDVCDSDFCEAVV
ncbi:uncharacterized protein V6R79_016458 [Siganus canaliculatus]